MTNIIHIFLISLLGLSLLANAIGYFAALQARKVGLERAKLIGNMNMTIFRVIIENSVLKSKVNGCGEFFEFHGSRRQRT